MPVRKRGVRLHVTRIGGSDDRRGDRWMGQGESEREFKYVHIPGKFVNREFLQPSSHHVGLATEVVTVTDIYRIRDRALCDHTPSQFLQNRKEVLFWLLPKNVVITSFAT